MKSLITIFFTAIAAFFMLNPIAKASSAIPVVDSFEASYFDYETFQEKTIRYRMNIQLSGALDEYGSKNNGDKIKEGAYTIIIKSEDGKLLVDKFQFNISQVDGSDYEKSGVSFSVYQWGVIYREVPELLKKRFADRGTDITSLSLLGGFIKGKQELSNCCGLNLIYEAGADISIPEIS